MSISPRPLINTFGYDSVTYKPLPFPTMPSGGASSLTSCSAVPRPSAAAGSFAGPILKDLHFEHNLIAHAIVGGFASLAGGGNFANGAVTAAFGYLFNRCGKGGCWTTAEERSLVNNGDYLGYYAKACEGGDTYACEAYHVAARDTFWGNATTIRVENWLKEFGGYRWADIPQILENIRIELAQAYANYLPQDQDHASWPAAKGIAEFHWDVFEPYGVPPSGFGGTPFGSKGPIIGAHSWPWNWCTICK